MKAPERVAGVFFFACNMDPSGVRHLSQSSFEPVLRSTREGLRPAIGYAGALQRLCGSRYPDAADATQLLRARSREDQRACRFAPLQRPEQFNTAMLEFVGKVLPTGA